MTSTDVTPRFLSLKIPPSRVDTYKIAVRQTNTTGWPLPNGIKRDLAVPGTQRSASIAGLAGASYFAFVIRVGAGGADGEGLCSTSSLAGRGTHQRRLQFPVPR
jgi:hypothetical protein